MLTETPTSYPTYYPYLNVEIEEENCQHKDYYEERISLRREK